jgi:hypothetical protein
MKAQITAPQGLRAAPEGHTVVLFERGEIVTGWVAEMAIQVGAARKVDEIAASLEHKSAPPPAQEPPQDPPPVAPRRRGRPRKVV